MSTFSTYNINIENNIQVIPGITTGYVLSANNDGSTGWVSPQSGATGNTGATGPIGSTGATGNDGATGSAYGLTFSSTTGYVTSWTNTSILGTSSIKLTNNNIDLYEINYATASISGTYTQSLAYHQYVYTLTGNTIFGITAAKIATYNFLFNCATYSLTLNTGSFKSTGATTIGGTGSILMSGVYDGSRLWVANINTMNNL